MTGAWTLGKVAYRFCQLLFWLICAAVFVFLLAPIVAVIPVSFSSGSFLSYPLPGLSLQWYQEVFQNPQWLHALWNSILIACLSTALSVVLGVTASLGLMRQKNSFAKAFKVLVLSPMMLPVILMAVGLYFVLAPLGIANTLGAMLIAHTVLAVPFVVMPVLTALDMLDPNLLRAGAACGATPRQVFIHITLPAIMPAVASGAVFAFATSFDDVVMALLLAGPEQRTLPQEMFNSLRNTLSPTMTAVSTIMIVISTGLFMLTQTVQKRQKIRQGIAVH